MSHGPRVSVIIPAYNAEETVTETIGSVLRQTFRDFELIVVDDGSTDGTVERVRRIHDARLRVVSFPNGGLPVSRNRGLEAAGGELVSFIDADDLWTPDKLEAQVAALDRTGAALAYSWTAFIDGQGRFLFAKAPTRFEGDVYADLLRHCNFVASGSNLLVRRCCAVSVGGFDVRFTAAHDWDFCLRIAARWRFALVPRYQVLYRVSEGAMSANAEQAERNCVRLCERALAASSTGAAPSLAESLAAVDQYIAFLYLSRATGIDFRRAAGRKLVESIHRFPPILLKGSTWFLMLNWLVLGALPRSRRRSAVLALLRAYGRVSRLWWPEARRVAEEAARTTRALRPGLPAGTAGPRDRHGAIREQHVGGHSADEPSS